MTTVDEREKMDMNDDEYTYEEELKLSADRDRFVNYMRTLKEVNFAKKAKKVENRKEKENK